MSKQENSTKCVNLLSDQLLLFLSSVEQENCHPSVQCLIKELLSLTLKFGEVCQS